ncbi:MAG: ABC transporter ATP-binding protein [Planctomycetota bacterium]
MSLLEVLSIRKTFGTVQAVDGLSFEVQPGETFGLLGPNGAGKTTTMSIIAGLIRQDAGTLRFDGRDVTQHDTTFRRSLGVVPQNLAVYPDLTAQENLCFFGRLYGVAGQTLKERLAWALDRSGLTQHADRAARTFSGGMNRRLNFAAALMHRPRFLMLDEPTVGVDPQSRAYLLDCVRQLRHEGVSTIYASHYMEEVEAICDRIAIVDHGKVVATGTLDELLSQLQIEIRLRVVLPPGPVEHLSDTLRKLPHVSDVAVQSSSSENEWTVLVQTELRSDSDVDVGPLTQQLLDSLSTSGGKVLSVSTQDSTLERLFLELTGRSLRD